MTIVVVAAAHDGIVLASDSRTTQRRGPGHRIASDSTRKIVVPWPGLAIAGYGLAVLGGRTVAGLLEEFAASRSDDRPGSAAQVAQQLSDFFGALISQAAGDRDLAGIQVSFLGFLVASYDEQRIGRVVEVTLPARAGVPTVRSLDVNTRSPGFLFRGQGQHIRRLLEGYDADAFRQRGADALLTDELSELLGRQAYIMNQPVNVQDALDTASFIVRMTIDMERLSDGTIAAPGTVPLCGGPVQAVLVSRAGTEWIANPSLRIRAAGMAEWG